MPNTTSAAKALRQGKKRAERNKKIKVDLKTTIKKSRKAMASGDKKKAGKLVSEAVKLLDKAAQKKVIKKNNAARRKSRLVRQAAQMEKK